jgi:arabinogalactan oligomer/maltooligosaccharide transport system permease protein
MDKERKIDVYSLEHEQNIKKQFKFLGLIPGLGQFKNKQAEKGILFLLAFLVFFGFGLNLGLGSWKELFSAEINKVNGENAVGVAINALMGIQFIILSIGIMFLARKDATDSALKLSRRDTPMPFEEQMSYLFEENTVAILGYIPLTLILTFMVVPVIFTIMIAFLNYDSAYKPTIEPLVWVGFGNFTRLAQTSGFSEQFLSVLQWTIVWTILGTAIPMMLGFIIALVINKKGFKGARVARSILILPMAIPAFITISLFGQMFIEGGIIDKVIMPIFLPLINAVAGLFGQEVTSIGWKQGDGTATKVALIMIQTWLAFPYFVTLFTATLQSIPSNLYDAAKIDGANVGQQTRKITIPMVIIATIPAIVGQFAFNFNNYLLIYLFNNGGPNVTGQTAGKTDILISWVIKQVVSSGQAPDYAMVSIVSLLSAAFTVTISLVVLLRSSAFKKEEMM